MLKTGIGIAAGIILILTLIVGYIWSDEPDLLSDDFYAPYQGAAQNKTKPTGFATLETLTKVADTLLHKPGGYISNDIMPPGIFLDNITNWEYGALIQVRDFTRALRKYISRSQSQSTEDPDLVVADPKFHFDSERWAFSSTESQYEDGITALRQFQGRLSATGEPDAQFFARADNLRSWLDDVEKSLGSLSQRLTASVGQKRVNTDLAGDPSATQSTYKPIELVDKTPWTEIDDVFYQARGTTWVLIHLLRAIDIDFAQVLEKKNARVSLRQIIRELESAQATVWSPVILNGSGFGLVANHSLVMASYIARANAAIIDLRDLLAQG